MRLRAATPIPAPEMTALVNALAAAPGVTRALGRPNTGSVILEFAGNAEALAESLSRSGAARILPAPAPPPVGQAAQLGLLRLDRGIRDGTDGALDLHSALATLLLGAAAVQTLRGQIAGPAATLAMMAFSLLDRRDGT